jgi:hypothetical protein
MALDAARGEVYWSTDVGVWKAPVAGSTPIPVAGNLGRGTPAATCSGCGGRVSTNPNYLAVGPSNVYIADHQPMANQLLQVKK